ncbi:MAG TPA: hypothetical protein VGR02_02300 [Thermoanaerobaculia bacterium]|jgi:hypothetical protein|nr:hypothetical protein [Thermoanaerobaculia bacterium]
MRHKTDLIVPIRDRRRGRRILTLRNFGIALGVAVLLFVVLTVASEFRHPKEGEYGRLVAGEVPKTELQPQTREIVSEAPVPDETAADPMLITSQARAQYLGVDKTRGPAPAGPDGLKPVPTSPAQPVAPILRREHGKVAIVGDSTGVTMVTQTAGQEHKLTGGYFREQ